MTQIVLLCRALEDALAIAGSMLDQAEKRGSGTTAPMTMRTGVKATAWMMVRHGLGIGHPIAATVAPGR